MNIKPPTLWLWLTDENHKVHPIKIVWVLAWVGSLFAAPFGSSTPLVLLVLYTIWYVVYHVSLKLARVIGNWTYMAQYKSRARPKITRVKRNAPKPDDTPWPQIVATLSGLYTIIFIGLCLTWKFDFLYWMFVILGIGLTEAFVVLMNLRKNLPFLSKRQAWCFVAIWFVAGLVARLAQSNATLLVTLIMITNIAITLPIRRKSVIAN